jgi:hypothetical protein
VPTTVPPPSRPEQLLYSLPLMLRDMDGMRGSVIVLDWRWLRDNDMFDRYAATLGVSHPLLQAAAAEWVDLPLVREHYRALDALGMTHSEAIEVGKTVGPRIHGVVLKTLVRLAGQLGVGPFVALGQSYKLWTRSFRGGGVAVYRTTDRSARIEILQTVISQSRFFRASFIGVTVAALDPFCENAIVQERAEGRTDTSFVLRVSWDG